jgi:hypothetical protein
MATSISSNLTALLSPQGGKRQPTLTLELIASYPAGAKLTARERKQFLAAYHAGTPGIKAAMRKRLMGTAESIAQKAAGTRQQRNGSDPASRAGVADTVQSKPKAKRNGSAKAKASSHAGGTRKRGTQAKA